MAAAPADPVDLTGLVGPFAGCLDVPLLAAYSAALGDPSARARVGTAAPITSLVTQVWEAQEAARSTLVSGKLWSAATGGVHGEHDIVMHRPVLPGEPLTTWVQGWGARPAGRNAAVTLRYLTRDESGDLVAEQWWTTILLGTTCARVGTAPPPHAFPDPAREHTVGSRTQHVDADMARRYAEVSGDWSPHHFEVAAARAAGFDTPFLHGLATMGLCAQGIVDLVAGGDPDRLRRLAVRFAVPTFLDSDLALEVFRADEDQFAFEAHSGGALVVTHGRAELRS